MVIGFLGKGGSGKSSVATQFNFFVESLGKNILAIDADHNMDLSYNLTNGKVANDMQYLGSSLDELQTHVGLTEGEKYTQAFLGETNTRFSFDPDNIDSFTKKYSVQLKDKVRLMCAGPQTDQVLYGQSCSHILTTPLKIYLPLLELHENDMVIVDEKAGADGVTTGIVTGIDVGVIVCEPALHSIKTAKQIADLLTFYETPFIVVGNKISDTGDKDFITSTLEDMPAVYLEQNSKVKKAPSEQASEWKDSLSILYSQLQKLNNNNRLERTKKKFERNRAFETS